MLDALNWEPLSQRRAKNRVTMQYKINNNQVTIDPNTYLNKSDTVLEGNININNCNFKKHIYCGAYGGAPFMEYYTEAIYRQIYVTSLPSAFHHVYPLHDCPHFLV